MPVTWRRLEYGAREVCASASHDHDVSADWRMESGGIGSCYCDACRLTIDRSLRDGSKQHAAEVYGGGRE